jgi:AraC-like DNA-binding protein
VSDDDVLFSIGQLSRRTGLAVRTIRFWSDDGDGDAPPNAAVCQGLPEVAGTRADHPRHARLTGRCGRRLRAPPLEAADRVERLNLERQRAPKQLAKRRDRQCWRVEEHRVDRIRRLLHAIEPQPDATYLVHTRIMSGVAREQPRTDGKIMMKRAEGRRSQECLRTLRSLARKAHRSRSRLVRAFDATIGMSPMAFLRQMRVERMAGLLATTDLSIAEAARTVGWTDSLYASRCLHAAYLMF